MGNVVMYDSSPRLILNSNLAKSTFAFARNLFFQFVIRLEILYNSRKSAQQFSV